MTSEYKVKPGDSLTSIAAASGVSVPALLAANPHVAQRPPPIMLNRGEMLKMPAPPPATVSTKQAPQPAAQVPAVDTQKSCVRCDLEQLAVMCGHKARTYQLIVPPPAGTSKPVYTLEVIADQPLQGASQAASVAKEMVLDAPHLRDAMKVRVKKKACPNGKPGCQSVLLSEPGSTATEHGKNFTFDARLSSEAESAMDDFTLFFRKIWGYKNQPVTHYALTTKTCDGNGAIFAVVAVYPKYSWSGGISVGYEYEAHKDSNFNQNQGWKKVKVHGRWVIDGSLEAEYGARKISFNPSTAVGGAHQSKHFTQPLFRGVQRVLDSLAPVVGKLKTGVISFKINWPKIKLSGGSSNEEEDSGPRVIRKGKVTLAAEPLIGLHGTIDILDVVLLMCPGFGPFVQRVKDELEDGVGKEGLQVKGQLSVNLTAGADLKGSLEWSFGATGHAADGTIDCEIPLSIEGVASVELEVWIIKAGASVKVGAKSSVGAKLKASVGPSGPELSGKLYFTGITIYYVMSYEVGGPSYSPGKHPRDSNLVGKIKELKAAGEDVQSEIVMQPCEWPDGASPSIPLADW